MAVAIPVQTLPTAVILRQALRANPENGFLYLNNPKVGCSTIKAALWSGVRGALPESASGSVHVLEGSPFLDWLDDAGAAAGLFVFTAVRNPYQRIVSAYLDKIAPAVGEIWETFVKQAGLDGAALSFDAFIEVLSGLPPERFDPHWRPQYLNTLQPFLRPNLVVDLEALDGTLPMVLDRLFPGRVVEVSDRRPRSHGTSARVTWRAHLADAATLRRVEEIFQGDFACFDYAMDLGAEPGALVPLKHSEHRHDGLAALLRFYQAEAQVKAKLLQAVAAQDEGGHLGAWVLAHRLGYNFKEPTRIEELIAGHADLVAAGPDLLREAVMQARGAAT